jgi:cell division protein FtsZ
MATSSPLLETNISGAQGVLFSITGGTNLSLFEIEEAAGIIKETADPEANIIFGTVIDERMNDEVTITVIATGFDSSRKRDGQRQSSAGTVDASAALRAARENRDYLRELDAQRTPGAPLEGSVLPPANGATTQPQLAAVPVGEPELPAQASDRAPTPELEDLEIPAFLRRNR